MNPCEVTVHAQEKKKKKKKEAENVDVENAVSKRYPCKVINYKVFHYYYFQTWVFLFVMHIILTMLIDDTRLKTIYKHVELYI